uniref:Uncharacterized protein n=1 Tax=Chromera velia CCMP2878 TaxID=1169474 RepID=A0A0G4HT46_9ALVE|eukprot:Cvel_31267.t1-p1 / transcript=Cvel_31267.t1 / gene=Cvel_31267 / organism=Chromera_velia_CCMP2878 / gene_product=Zinc finger protein 571, putative / transcript_product=Zinc finger protein 571, putative / location=Cvel_scaffold4628:1994-2643(-) / protein_length=190 / sequence_SO=supercontig / SO=protein_coding / is_pseudo=false
MWRLSCDGMWPTWVVREEPSVPTGDKNLDAKSVAGQLFVSTAAFVEYAKTAEEAEFVFMDEGVRSAQSAVGPLFVFMEGKGIIVPSVAEKEYASMVVNAANAVSATGVRSASTVVTDECAKNVGEKEFANMVGFAGRARSVAVEESVFIKGIGVNVQTVKRTILSLLREGSDKETAERFGIRKIQSFDWV